MRVRILILGAGFGGLELAATLSRAVGPDVDIAVIEQSDAFVFGYSKLDLLFGRATPKEVQVPYTGLARSGVRLLHERVVSVDPVTRRVTTSAGQHDCDYLVIALGADYDIAATPGLEHAGEFYSIGGAQRAHSALNRFKKGTAVIGVCGVPFKCPPAPSECALMLHDYLVERGLRPDCGITLVLPLPAPVPPSPETSRALLAAFEQREIRFIPERRVVELETAVKEVILDDGSRLPYDLFLGVPIHRAPAALQDSGLLEDGWVHVNPRTLNP